MDGYLYFKVKTKIYLFEKVLFCLTIVTFEFMQILSPWAWQQVHQRQQQEIRPLEPGDPLRLKPEKKQVIQDQNSLQIKGNLKQSKIGHTLGPSIRTRTPLHDTIST